MSIHNTTQICGVPTITFRRDQGFLFCTVDKTLTLEAKHIRMLAAALDNWEAEQTQIVAAEVAA